MRLSEVFLIRLPAESEDGLLELVLLFGGVGERATMLWKNVRNTSSKMTHIETNSSLPSLDGLQENDGEWDVRVACAVQFGEIPRVHIGGQLREGVRDTKIGRGKVRLTLNN